jgi:RNase P subunit RPR2
MAASMTEKMSEASATRTPKKGERFHCEKCGMEIQITVDCKCEDPHHVQFTCCGQPMAKNPRLR